ncbi:MAG: hypothetical protein AAF389_10570 [Gemmatimonadota bacterium]
MALPPNAFKDLVSDSPAESYEALRRAGCLSWKGRRSKEDVLELMRESLRRSHARADTGPGPTSRDRLAAALLSSTYVSWKGRWLARRDTR